MIPIFSINDLARAYQTSEDWALQRYVRTLVEPPKIEGIKSYDNGILNFTVLVPLMATNLPIASVTNLRIFPESLIENIRITVFEILNSLPGIESFGVHRLDALNQLGGWLTEPPKLYRTTKSWGGGLPPDAWEKWMPATDTYHRINAHLLPYTRKVGEILKFQTDGTDVRTGERTGPVSEQQKKKAENSKLFFFSFHALGTTGMQSPTIWGGLAVVLKFSIYLQNVVVDQGILKRETSGRSGGDIVLKGERDILPTQHNNLYGMWFHRPGRFFDIELELIKENRS